MKYLILLFVFLNCSGRENHKGNKVKSVADTSVFMEIDTIGDDKFDINDAGICDTVYFGGISGGGTTIVTIGESPGSLNYILDGGTISHEIPLLIDTAKWNKSLIAYYTANQLK